MNADDYQLFYYPLGLRRHWSLSRLSEDEGGITPQRRCQFFTGPHKQTTICFHTFSHFRPVYVFGLEEETKENWLNWFWMFIAVFLSCSFVVSIFCCCFFKGIIFQVLTRVPSMFLLKSGLCLFCAGATQNIQRGNHSDHSWEAACKPLF